MGSDPETSVADGRGELHDVKGVWIGDAQRVPDRARREPDGHDHVARPPDGGGDQQRGRRMSADAAPAPAESLTGACMCGKVTFEISAPLLGAAYCHCTRCQRRTGNGSSVGGLCQEGTFRVTAGEELVRCWTPADGGWAKCFCGECGGHVYGQDPENRAAADRAPRGARP